MANNRILIKASAEAERVNLRLIAPAAEVRCSF